LTCFRDWLGEENHQLVGFLKDTGLLVLPEAPPY